MNKFVTYNSSAGSGKTYTLVKEYLKIALSTNNERAYKNTLALTFTNKAASEMKERVVLALQAFSGLIPLEGTPKLLLEDLIQPESDGGIDIPKEELIERSKKVLRSILHNYNDFGISTIDKFTHKVIRTFAHDLHLPLNFDIEIDETEALSKSIDLLIAEVGVNKKLTTLLVDYTKSKANDESSWHIEKELFTFSRNLLKDDGEIYLEKLRSLTIHDFDKIKKQLITKTKAFEQKVMEIGRQAIQTIKDRGIEEPSFSSSFFPNYWKDLISLKKFSPTATTTKIINGEKNWYAAKVDSSQKELIDAYQNEFIALYNESRSFIDEFLGNYKVDQLLLKNLYNLAVLNEIEKTVIEFKKEHNVLNIADFNKRISQIVESEPIPFIYERVGEKYNHYLIDEFQDTSVIQWHNLIPLIDNSLASGHFNMVVGDAKQSIYRFRGGEVEQIIQLPKIYKNKSNPLFIERQETLQRNYKNKTLNTNYRSKAEIVSFNNEFFKSISTHLPENYQELYRNLQQEYLPNKTGGGVSIEFFETENKEPLSVLNLEKTKELIQQNLNDDYQLNDIAILTRNNKDGAAIASYLIENGINVISSESLLLINSKEVQCMVDLFGYISKPSDKNYQLKVLNYLIDNRFTEDSLFDVFSQYPKSTLFYYLKEKGLNIVAQQVNNLSLYELAEYIIKQFKLDKSVNGYIQFFLDKIYEYTIRNDNSIINFMEWWEAKSHKFSIVVPDGVKAVTVMSIHKSKGLEFPVVIYPFAISSVRLNEQFFWTDNIEVEGLKSAVLPINREILETQFKATYQDELDKSVLDLMNILYVAFTRAQDRLYMLSEVKFKSGKRVKSKRGSVSDYLYDFCEDKSGNKVKEHHFSFGLFSKNEETKKEEKIDEKFDSVVYNDWREKIKISYQAPEVWEVDNPQKIGEYGTLIHKILSEIWHLEDVEAVLDSFLLKGIVNETEIPAIKKQLTAIFNLKEIQYLFTDFDDVKNEANILTTAGETYQPDRVIIKDGKTIIVDYKTGEQQSTHIKQIKNYKARLTEMGYTHIESYLLYINKVQLVQV